jgi:hypothetical protein
VLAFRIVEAGLEATDVGMSKATGDEGERYVAANVPCPNCSKPLQQLPASFPLYDVQCSSCLFRAQVKTPRSKPRGRIRGAGWRIMEHALKTGQPVPPLIVNFVWQAGGGKQHREVRFYPLIPRRHLERYKLGPTHSHPNYPMFNYIGLDRLPCFVLAADKTWRAPLLA